MNKWDKKGDIKRGNVMSVMRGLEESLGGMGIEGSLDLDGPHSHTSFLSSLINRLLGATPGTLLPSL